MRSPGKPLRAVFIRSYLLFGHSVLLGRYFNVDSNKLSNKKQENAKCLKERLLQTKTIALLTRWLWVRAPPNPNILSCWQDDAT